MHATRPPPLLLLLVPAAGAFYPHAILAPRLLVSFEQPMPAALATAPARASHAMTASTADAPVKEQQLDVGSLGRCLFAVLLQMMFISTAFGVIDVCSYGPLPGGVGSYGPLPWQAVVGIFVALSLGSRIFSPLDATRLELRSPISAEDDEGLKELLAVLANTDADGR